MNHELKENGQMMSFTVLARANEMNTRARSVLTFAASAVAFFSFAATANAGVLYTESFTPFTGSQSTNNGQTFANYGEWTYGESPASTSNARVDLLGELTLAGGAPVSHMNGLVSASTIVGTPAFDVSDGRTLTVSGEVGSRFGTAGNFNAGLVVGNVVFRLHPGFAGGAHRVSNLFESTTYMPNTNMGFTPGTGNNFTPVSITVQEVGPNYQFTYSIGSYNNVISIAQASVGPINNVGLAEAGTGDGNFRNFEVSATVPAPEPSTFALVVLAFAGMMGCRRRQR